MSIFTYQQMLWAASKLNQNITHTIIGEFRQSPFQKFQKNKTYQEIMNLRFWLVAHVLDNMKNTPVLTLWFTIPTFKMWFGIWTIIIPKAIINDHELLNSNKLHNLPFPFRKNTTLTSHYENNHFYPRPPTHTHQIRNNINMNIWWGEDD